MLREIHKYVAVVDGRSGYWQSEVTDNQNNGCNFFVILPHTDEAPADLAHALEVEVAHVPRPVSHTQLFSMGSFISTKDFDLLLAAQDAGNVIYFVELLDLPSTQPPRVKPYVLYGSIRGIISQHDTLPDAKQACEDYLNQVSLWHQKPEASIYKWHGKDWYNLELC